jgi:hypothetical protein
LTIYYHGRHEAPGEEFALHQGPGRHEVQAQHNPLAAVPDTFAWWDAPTPQQHPQHWPPPQQLMCLAQRPDPMATVGKVAAVVISVLSGLVIGFLLLVVVALAAGPPAEAAPQQTRTTVQYSEGFTSDATRSVIVNARYICPDEDSCQTNYIGDGTWMVERIKP